MAGSNNPNNRQGNRQQGGSQQGAPQQGGRRQQGRGAQQGGRQRQQQQRRQPPAGGGGGISGGGGTTSRGDFLKGIIGTMAAAGILLGVTVFLIGEVGGFPVLPEASGTAEEAASQAGQSEAYNSVLTNSHKTLLGYLTAEVAPFIAFIMAPIFGLAAAFQLKAPVNAKMRTVSVGTFIGSVLFVFIVTFLASMVVPDLTDFPLDAAAGTTGSQTAALSAVETGLGSIQFVNTLINGVTVGIMGAVTAAATVFSIDSFS